MLIFSYMENKSQYLVKVVIVLLAFILLTGAAYLYLRNKNSSADSISSVALREAVGVDDLNILARGDVDGDGYEDVLVQYLNCGASCSVSLQIVLNEGGKRAVLFKDKNYPDTFSPAYESSSAAKSEVTGASIKNGIISIAGRGLECMPPGSEDICTEENWSVVKTATYKFDGSNLVQLSVTPLVLQ
jgi:hypothetical protein